MQETIAEWVLGLVAAAIVGLVAWVWSLWRSHGELKSQVSEHIGQSFTRSELDEVMERVIEPIRSDIRELRNLIIGTIGRK
jgi:hypothetical protein